MVFFAFYFDVRFEYDLCIVGFDKEMKDGHKSRSHKPPLKWITMSMWEECLFLSSKIHAFLGFCKHLHVNERFWLDFSEVKNPYVYLAMNGNALKLGKKSITGTAENILY